MARHLILHAGMPRAGSSSLQEVLFHYRDRLEAQGLLYPALGPDVLGTADDTQRYNHRALQRSARFPWRWRSFNRFHDDIARQMAASAAPKVILSYEGWWEPANIPGLARSVKRITAGAACDTVEIAVIARDPVSFLRSIYKLDVLYGRTSDLLADYWPRQLSDPRLRYSTIAAAYTRHLPEARLNIMSFDRLSEGGRFAGKFMAALGEDGILTRAALQTLEAHHYWGGDLFSDASVSMALFAARHMGLRRFRQKRKIISERISRLVQNPDFADELKALVIPLDQSSAHAIEQASRAEAEPFFRQHLQMDYRRATRIGDEAGTQSLIAADSALGRALITSLEKLG